MSFENACIKKIFALVLLFLGSNTINNNNIRSVSAFSIKLSVSPSPVFSINFQWLSDIFSSSSNNNDDALSNNDTNRLREELKMKLLETCSSSNNNNNNNNNNDNDNDMNTKRIEIESIIEALVKLRPIDATASNPIFQKNWLL